MVVLVGESEIIKIPCLSISNPEWSSLLLSTILQLLHRALENVSHIVSLYFLDQENVSKYALFPLDVLAFEDILDDLSCNCWRIRGQNRYSALLTQLKLIIVDFQKYLQMEIRNRKMDCKKMFLKYKPM